MERTVSVESHLSNLELLDFLKSAAVMALGDSFVVPSAGIDYGESTTIYIGGPDGKEKHISIRDYATAGLEEKSKLPVALIVLLNEIEKIEKSASVRGKTATISCPLPD